MLKPGIDPEKLYRATFIRQYGLCCCNMALVSFRLFCKNLGHLREFFGQMVYRPPWRKISRTPMFGTGIWKEEKRHYCAKNSWRLTGEQVSWGRTAVWEAWKNERRRRDAGRIETAGNGSSERVVRETGPLGGRNRGRALINFFCL